MRSGFTRKRIGFFVALLATFPALAVPTTEPHAMPLVPGYQVLKDSGKMDIAAQGELLLGELNCIACHTAGLQSRINPKGAPDLTEAGLRITPQYLRHYLSNPHQIKPGTTMPDLFHASATAAKTGAVDFLVHFLVSQGGPIADPVGAGTKELVEQGRKLYESVGCVACHSPEKADALKTASVPLGDLAMKNTLDALTSFLLDPVHVRPSGRMPSSNLTPGEAKAISIFLLRQQLDVPSPTSKPLPGTGLNFAYFDAQFTSAASEKFAGLQPMRSGRVKNFTVEIPGGKKDQDHFGIKYTGWIWIPRNGQYTFTVESDDGAILFIDSKTVAENEGTHPMKPGKSGEIALKSGQHPIELTYFQNGGGAGLEVFWKGPGIKFEPLPMEVLAATGGKAMTPLKNEAFTVDPDKAKTGGQMFAMLGCAACHVLPEHPSLRPAQALADLNVGNPEGCLGDRILKGRPNYDLSPDQKGAIVAALKNVASFATPLDATKRVVHEMAAMNCFACHQRDGISGVTADRNAFFKSTITVDLGDDGRLPPLLTGAGAKLLPAALDRILFHNELRIRPYIATRMPSYSPERLKDFPGMLASADAAGIAGNPPAAVTPHAEKEGWKLVGVKGLGCINCHGARGAKSIGVPGADLTVVRDRVRPEWFRRWMADPGKLVPGTRMPSFWNEGKSSVMEIAGGAFDPQVNAIWTYLQQGPEMVLPLGLRLDDSDEIVPFDEIIVLRAFVTGVGSRSILVGNPESIHWVFDANTMRLAKAWRGKFFDAAGIWESRGGSERGPLGKDIIDLPAGPSFAVLDSQAAPWPEANRDARKFERNTGGTFKGYTLDKQGRPTFRYVLNEVMIQETESPVGSGEKAGFERNFKLTAGGSTKDLFFLAATGRKIEEKGPGVWLIDGRQTIHLSVEGQTTAVTEIRDGKDGMKLLVAPIKFLEKAAVIKVEVGW